MQREKARLVQLKKAAEEGGTVLEPLAGGVSGAVANQRARQLATRAPGATGEEEPVLDPVTPNPEPRTPAPAARNT
jgi:hypothetical protein